MKKKGLILYHEADYLKNKWFATHLIDIANDMGFNSELVLSKDLCLGLCNNKRVARVNARDLSDVSFVISRLRDFKVSKHFENMGIRVFNNSQITDIANHKMKTHIFINDETIPSIDTFFFDKENFNLNSMPLDYPFVLKSPTGHGGGEIFLVKNRDMLYEALKKIEDKDFLIQKLSEVKGRDVRVFIVNNRIIGSVIRKSEVDFRANYSLGGYSEKYNLSKSETALVQRILGKINLDFGGIDFIFNKDGEFLFNEIEDVVGSRTFYENFSEDIAQIFLEHIDKTINN